MLVGATRRPCGDAGEPVRRRGRGAMVPRVSRMVPFAGSSRRVRRASRAMKSQPAEWSRRSAAVGSGPRCGLPVMHPPDESAVIAHPHEVLPVNARPGDDEVRRGRATEDRRERDEDCSPLIRPCSIRSPAAGPRVAGRVPGGCRRSREVPCAKAILARGGSGSRSGVSHDASGGAAARPDSGAGIPVVLAEAVG